MQSIAGDQPAAEQERKTAQHNQDATRGAPSEAAPDAAGDRPAAGAGAASEPSDEPELTESDTEEEGWVHGTVMRVQAGASQVCTADPPAWRQTSL